nr:MAG TPA_asm: hypothetical protein [Caudoviricetes sp.]
MGFCPVACCAMRLFVCGNVKNNVETENNAPNTCMCITFLLPLHWQLSQKSSYNNENVRIVKGVKGRGMRP